MTAPIDGVACPLVTPLRGGRVDTASLRAHIKYLLDAGIDALVPCGTTGEFASLTDEERATVIETAVEAADGRIPVVAGAADTTVAGVTGWIDRVVATGAEAALVPPPYYHNGSEDGLRQFFESVLADSTGDIVLYNFPALTGQSIPIDTLGYLADHERVVGLKDSSTNFQYALRAESVTPEGFPIMVGADRFLATVIAEGIAGGVVGLSNVVPGAMVEIHEAADRGDREQATEIREERIDPILAVVEDHGYVPVIKRLLAERGTIERPEVRPPLTDAPVKTISGLLD